MRNAAREAFRLTGGTGDREIAERRKMCLIRAPVSIKISFLTVLRSHSEQIDPPQL